MKEKKHSNSTEHLYKIFIYVVLILLAVIIIVPVAWVFMASIKQNKEFYGNPEHSTAPQETRPISLDASDLTKCSVSSGIDLPKQPENIDSDFQRDVPKSTEQSAQNAIQKWKAQNPPLTNQVRSASRVEKDAPQPSKEGLNDLLERLRKEHATPKENG